jgi:hypothetical protein
MSDLQDIIKRITREPANLVEAQLRQDLGSELMHRPLKDLRTDIESAAEIVKFDYEGARELARQYGLL